ncbi:MAG: PAC2 family protein [Acidimicrobiia bacterium]|nr:PAC2 family protein [Acidimicrobiia bacterium]
MDPASDLYELRARPELDSPVLVMAPDGWIDAGLGGAGAVAAMLAVLETEVVASFDVDRLLDHRSRRPISHMLDGVYTDLVWPHLELLAAHDPEGRAMLVLVGPEPDHEWRGFSDAIGELATMFGVRLAVGLGAFPAGVPHTRASRVAATASNAELANQLGVVSGSVEVPAGVVAAVERRLAQLGIPTIAIWARVPHYAASMPYPPASVQLLDGLTTVTGIRVDAPELVAEATATRERLDELTANSLQHTALVRQLEAQVDSEGGADGAAAADRAAGQVEATEAGWGTLPTGDELAAEVERFLQQGE